MKPKFNFHDIISILRSNEIISKIDIRNVDEIKGKAVYRIRCNLIPSRYKFEMRLIQMEKEILYSYQVFTDKPIVRWDNAPHYKKIKTYPHHFHTKDGNVIESRLKGNVTEDLEKVLSTIKEALKEHDRFAA